MTIEAMDSSSEIPRIALFETYGEVLHGNSRYMLLLASGLDPRSLRPSLITSSDDALLAAARERGLDTILYPYPPSLKKYGRRLLSDAFIRILGLVRDVVRYNLGFRRLLETQGFELVHCTSVRSVLSVGFGTRLAGRKLTWVVQMEFGHKLLDSVAMVLSDKIIFISPKLQEAKPAWLRRVFARKICVVPLGVDLDDSLGDPQVARAQMGVSSESFVVGTSASLVPLKGVHILIEAVAGARAKGVPIECVIIGAGLQHEREYTDRLRNMVRELDLESCVHLLGWRGDASRLVRGLDLFVLPSLSEGLSRATVEAMWMERPVVVSDTGAMADLVDDTVGRLVPRNNAEAISEAIYDFWRNPKIAAESGRAGRIRVLERHKLSSHLDTMGHLFLEVLENKSSRMDKVKVRVGRTMIRSESRDQVGHERSALRARFEWAVRFAMCRTLSGVLPLYIVTEFPKSGGSWFSQMLADALQVPFPRNRLPGLRPQVMHGHYRYSSHLKNAVALMRDGRDIMCSMYFYMLFKNDLYNRPMSDRQARRLGIENRDDYWSNMPRFIEYAFTGKGFPRFTWAQFVNDWTDRNVPHVKYEELLVDAPAALQITVESLTGTHIKPERAEEIANRYSFERLSQRKPGQESRESFLRKGVAGDWREKFSPTARELFDHYAGEALIRLGYECDHKWVTETVHQGEGMQI